MATSARQDNNGYNTFLDKYRSNLNTPRGPTGYVPSSCVHCSPRSSGTQQQTNYMSSQQGQNYGTNVNTTLLRATGNVIRDERFGNDILARAGPSHQYQRSEYRTQEVIAPEGRVENLNIQSDSEPIRVVRPTDQNIHYKQQVNVRFLEPPPGPEPAPIIIKERQAPAPPPPPPLVIRQRPPTPPTPPPLIIRERPPTPPAQQETQIIERVLPAPPAPPRQVIVERLPPPPPKPRQVIYEKWLPYQETKERPVIVERAPPPEMIKPPKNLIIEYEQPRAHHEQVIVDEGVFRADPRSHNATSTMGEIRIVDRITDLPVNYSKYMTNRRSSSNALTSSSNVYDSHQYQQQQQQPQAAQTQYTSSEPTQQHRSTTYNYPGAYSTTYRSSYQNQYANRNGGNDVNQSTSFTKYT